MFAHDVARNGHNQLFTNIALCSKSIIAVQIQRSQEFYSRQIVIPKN